MVALDENDVERMRTLDWTIDAQTKTEVAFSFLTTTGFKIRKRFVLPTGDDRYDLDLLVTVERTGTPPAKDEKTVALRLLGVSGHVHEPSPQSIAQSPIQAVRLVLDTEDEPSYQDWNFPTYELTPRGQTSRAFRLTGTRSQYFASVLWSEGGPRAPAVKRVWVDGGDARRRNYAEATERLKDFYRTQRNREPNGTELLGGRVADAALNFQRAWVEFDAPLSAAGTEPLPSTFHVFSGPLSRRVLAQDRYEPLHDLITYPVAPDLVARFLLWVFDRFRDLTGSAGIAIILMTLFVRFSMMPLSVRNQLSMRRHGRKISKIKPKLEALKVKHAKDPRKFREEQVALFKEHGIGFPLGCFMLLFQIPIFMALFSSLRIEYGVRHEAFLWIHDLAGPDRLIPFGKAIFSFPPGGLWSLNILPLLYMGLSIWQQRLMPKPMDEQQAQQMKTAKWMSIIFPVLLYNYTAALALYMVISTTIAILESRIVRAKDAHDAATM
jgi:YidC/Oxa1 family membrane protein insertase